MPRYFLAATVHRAAQFGQFLLQRFLLSRLRFEQRVQTLDGGEHHAVGIHGGDEIVVRTSDQED